MTEDEMEKVKREKQYAARRARIERERANLKYMSSADFARRHGVDQFWLRRRLRGTSGYKKRRRGDLVPVSVMRELLP
jgi:hypothetical protein